MVKISVPLCQEKSVIYSPRQKIMPLLSLLSQISIYLIFFQSFPNSPKLSSEFFVWVFENHFSHCIEWVYLHLDPKGPDFARRTLGCRSCYSRIDWLPLCLDLIVEFSVDHGLLELKFLYLALVGWVMFRQAWYHCYAPSFWPTEEPVRPLKTNNLGWVLQCLRDKACPPTRWGGGGSYVTLSLFCD